jgi:hypothetical protein
VAGQQHRAACRGVVGKQPVEHFHAPVVQRIEGLVEQPYARSAGQGQTGQRHAAPLPLAERSDRSASTGGDAQTLERLPHLGR